jgi:hypothetical protein
LNSLKDNSNYIFLGDQVFHGDLAGKSIISPWADEYNVCMIRIE